MSFAVILAPLVVVLLLVNFWLIPSFDLLKPLRVWYAQLLVSLGLYLLYAVIVRPILRWKTPALIVSPTTKIIHTQQPNTSSNNDGDMIITKPTHLIIIQHGYCYNYSMQNAIQHWLANLYRSKIKLCENRSDKSSETVLLSPSSVESDLSSDNDDECVMIHVARSQSDEWTFGLWNTHDGVYKAGSRLKKEITEIVLNNPSIKDISLIGMSLGGLVIRKTAQLLYHHDQSQLSVVKGDFKQILNGRSFITMATPHLGCDDWIGSGDYRCSSLLNMWCVSRCLHSIHLLPPTLSNLLNLDKTLKMMSNDPEYLNALRCFDDLYLYSNVRGDTRVSCQSAAILPYSHDSEQYWNNPQPCEIYELDFSAISSDATSDSMTYPPLMTDLRWKRIIVSMNHNWFSRYLSHTVITILNPKWDSAQEVLNHLSNVFLDC